VLDVSGGNIRLVSNNSALIFRNNYQSITTDSAGNDLTYRTYQSHIWKNVTSTGSVSDGTERMRIDSSGRLLVGTSSSREMTGASFSLQIEGSGTSPYSGLSILNKANSSAPAYLILGKSRGGTNGVDAVSDASGGDGIGDIWFAAADGTDLASASARITCFVDGAVSGDDVPGRLVFSTTAASGSSPTERMKINKEGTTAIFANSDALYACTSNTASTNTAFAVYAGGASLASLGTKKFQVLADGDCENTNNSYGAISDIKLKENIIDASSQWDDLRALQVRNYNFKSETGYSTHTQIGLVAQEVELVSPGLVSESPDRDAEGNDLGTVTKSVNYSVLYMKAVKALQEAMERIEVLEAKVAALEFA